MSAARGWARPGKPVVLLVVATTALLLAPGTAHAADHGNWDGVCGDRGEACMWEGDIGPNSRIAASSVRDSSYANDCYNGLCAAHPLNDRVKNVSNEFSTLHVVAYHHANYVDPSTCIGGGVAIGPYPFNGNGISSFRSC